MAPTSNRSGSSLARSTKKEPSSPCGRPTRPTVTYSVDDLDKNAIARARRAGTDDRAQRPRDPALAADHLADVVLGHVQLQDVGALALDLLDANRVRVVDEPPRQLGEQFSQGSWPSGGAGRCRTVARPWRASPSPCPRRTRSSTGRSAGCSARRSR